MNVEEKLRKIEFNLSRATSENFSLDERIGHIAEAVDDLTRLIRDLLLVSNSDDDNIKGDVDEIKKSIPNLQQMAEDIQDIKDYIGMNGK